MLATPSDSLKLAKGISGIRIRIRSLICQVRWEWASSILSPVSRPYRMMGRTLLVLTWVNSLVATDKSQQVPLEAHSSWNINLPILVNCLRWATVLLMPPVTDKTWEASWKTISRTRRTKSCRVIQVSLRLEIWISGITRGNRIQGFEKVTPTKC